jgi:rSAM/selenodomain-associated transferase 2
MMNRFFFIFLCLSWLIVLAAMARIGHLSHHLILFSLFYGFAFILLLLLVSKFPQDLHPHRAILLILILGYAGRALFFFYPVGNDVFRYVWEGYIQNHGFNPYLHAPNDPALSALARGDLHLIWSHINHREFAAVYPPLTVLIFRGLAWVEPSPVFFKLVLVLFDLGVIIVLAQLIRLRQLSIKRLLLYACNPLVILFIAGEGHLDVIQVFLLFLGILFIINRKDISGFLCLGLALVSKYFTLFAVPFFITHRNRRKWIAVFLPLLLYIPYLDAGKDLFNSLMVFGTGMHYNDSMFALLRRLFGDSAHLAGLFIILICFIWIFLFVHERLRGAYLVFCCLMVFSPTVHPWYLVLIAPFTVFFPSSGWLYFQAAAVFTFPVMAVDYQTGIFNEIPWLKLFEYVPFYALLVRGFFRNGYLYSDRSYSPPKNISIIIPALNESQSIGPCLAALKHRTALKEIIVADGGSTDDTREIALKGGARVIRSQKGRGYQIKTGLQEAGGDAILVLHADCIARPGLFSRVIRTLTVNPDVVGGACGIEFKEKDLKTGIAARLNNIRAFCTGISFGDQAQFFRSQVVEQMGGFPDMMLMEDVELSIRLKQTGRVVYLKKGVAASGRRWRNQNFSKNFITVLWLFTRYLVERRFGNLAPGNQKYYIAYYGQQ